MRYEPITTNDCTQEGLKYNISDSVQAADPSSCRIQLRDTSIHHKKDDQYVVFWCQMTFIAYS